MDGLKRPELVCSIGLEQIRSYSKSLACFDADSIPNVWYGTGLGDNTLVSGLCGNLTNNECGEHELEGQLGVDVRCQNDINTRQHDKLYVL